MYNINKIRAHIKMLKFQELKLSRYLEEEEAKNPKNDSKIRDIARAHKRVTDNIKQWNHKLEQIEAMPARVPSRGSVIDGPDRPLIG